MSIFITIQIITATLAFINGTICAANPSQAIKIQQRFYEKINWKIEPINLKKELRNTKIMGMLSLVLAITIVINLLYNS